MQIKISNTSANIISEFDPENSSNKNEQLKIYYGNQKDYPNDLTCYYKFLSDKETERSKRYKNSRDERVYVISHALLNKKISELSGISLEQLKINYFENRKPYVEQSTLDFNLSHSYDYFAFVISNHENSFVGIDIEEVKDNLDINPIIENYFHENEKKYVLNFSSDYITLHQKFYKIWTRKEAFLKMLGTGLSENLPEIDMSMGERDMLIQDSSSHDISRFSNAYIYTIYLSENLVLSLSANCPVIVTPELCENF